MCPTLHPGVLESILAVHRRDQARDLLTNPGLDPPELRLHVVGVHHSVSVRSNQPSDLPHDPRILSPVADRMDPDPGCRRPSLQW